MNLVDQYGKEIKSGKPIIDEIAVASVRDRYNSYPSYGLTPDRLALILKEADQGYIFQQAQLAEEIEEKDGHFGSVLQTRKLAVAGLTWEMLPASDSADDKKIAAAAKEMFENIGGNSITNGKFEIAEGLEGSMIDTMDGILKSFAVQEIMWAIEGSSARGGNVRVDRLNWIHQKRFTFSGPPQQIGNQTLQPLLSVPRLLTDENMVWGEELVPNKFLFHRHKVRSGVTSRGGLLRAATYLYLFKNYDIKDWLIFNELFSVPMRVGKYKAGATQKEIDTLKQAVFNLGVDAAAVVSESTMIELLESKLRGDVSAFEKFHEMCEKTQSKIVLGHSAASDSTPGKLGNEQQGKDVRQDLLESDAKQIERTYRGQLLAPWTAYNYGPAAAVPKFKLHYEADEDLEQTARVYGILVKDIGFKGIPTSHIYDRFSIPQPVNGEETVTPPAPQAPPFALPSVSEASKTQANKKECGDPQACTCGLPHASPSSASLRLRGENILINKGAFDDYWISQYMDKLAPSLQAAKSTALSDVRAWLASLDSAPSAEEFDAKIKTILGDAYSQIDSKAVAAAVTDIYTFYRVEQPIAQVGAAFGGPDLRAMDFLSNVDHMFYSKFIENPDAQDAVTQFLKDRYLKGGEGLFGRGDPATAEEFQNLLSQKMTDISAYQANRIAETSVVRVRNWSHLNQLNEVGIEEIEIVEPTQECPFCIAMNGQVISVPAAHATMMDMIGMTDEEALAWYKDAGNAASLDNIGAFVNRGILPPYHPHCHGSVIKRVRQA